MTGLVAFVWEAMDAFFEEDEQVYGHAGDPYHRVDVRASRRHVVVRAGDVLVAETRRALVVFETRFAPRWYIPRDDVDTAKLQRHERQTLCPYKGIAHYFDVVTDERRSAAAWSYPKTLPESSRLTGYLSFDLEQLEVPLRVCEFVRQTRSVRGRPAY